MEQLLEKLTQLPPLPDVCLRLGELVEDPRCTAQSMAMLIEKDAALAADLLRLSNSAFYAVPGGIKTVQRAVTTLGFSAVHQFALCTLSNSVLKRSGSGLDPVLSQHARAVSVIAVKLANDARIAGREVTLAAGLLHDVGRMAVQVLAPERMAAYQKEALATKGHTLQLERELFGANHMQLAHLLGTHWRYPPALLDVIEHHHLESGDPVPTKATVTDAVSVADAWAASLGWPSLKDDDGMALDPRAAIRLGVGSVPSPGERVTLTALVQNAVTF